MIRWLRHLIPLLCSAELAAVEILEADPLLSGRLDGLDSVEAIFGEDTWSTDFRHNNYLVGSISQSRKLESSVLFVFRINEQFLSELSDGGAAQFLFTVPRIHEGDAKKVLPVEILLLKRNANSAFHAAQAEPARSLGEISPGELEDGRLYRFPLGKASDFQAGDIVWIGLNGRNPLDGSNHNFLIGGDLISLPGSVPPMLVAGSEKALSETVQGMSFLSLLNRGLNAPKHPKVARKEPIVSESKWINPITSKQQIDRLGAIENILRHELEKLPKAQRQFRDHALGFHSSVKPLDETWTLRLPIDGVATALCLVPAVTVEGDEVQPFAFPRRFSITAHLPNGETITVADWTSEDFPLRNSTPIVFSFPWQIYESLEFTIHQGRPDKERHFFALEELFLYRPLPEKQSQTVVEMTKSDSIISEPHWSLDYLTDGRTSLGPALMERVPDRNESIISFPADSQEEPAIILSLPKKRLIWNLDLHPIHDLSNPALSSTSFPQEMVIEFANDPGFEKIIRSLDATPNLRPVPVGGNPVSIRFEPVAAKFIRLRFSKLQDSKLGLAEIRVNHAHSLADAEITLHGFPATVNPTPFIDNHANGYRLGDPLPWMIRLIRRDVVNAELSEIEKGIETLKAARQRSFRLLFALIGGGLVLVFIGILFWQKRKSAAENLRMRRRIQQDLHDEIGSNLGTVSLISSHLLRADLPTDFLEEVADVNRSAREATSSLREVIWLTDKSILTLDKAFTYIQMRAEQMVHDCQLVVEAPKNVPALPIASLFKRNLFLLFTEAIHNSQKHANANKVVVTLNYEDTKLSMHITDDGCGFDPATVRESIGLQSMRERAEQLGGQLHITSEPNSGTTIELITKLPPA